MSAMGVATGSMRDSLFRAMRASLLGISAYEDKVPAAGTLDEKQVERLREFNGGEIQRQSQSQTRWYLSELEDAQYLADGGNLSQAGKLMKEARTDGVLAGVLSTRTSGLVRLPKTFRGDPEVIAALELGHDRVRSVFDEMLPATDLAQLAADGELLGVGVAELVPVEGRDFPVLRRLSPEFLRYRWNEGRWYFESAAGLLPITPGDGRWVLHTPGGRVAPWENGLWKALGRAFIRKSHAQLRKDEWEAKLANPARVAYAPSGSVEAQRDTFFKQVMAWGANTVFGLVPGYEVKLLESNGRGYESFVQTIKEQNEEIVICIAGQVVTTTGGTGFANADVHKSIRADLIKATADGLALTINTQILPAYVLTRWGEDALERRMTVVEWDVSPPKDRTAEATSMNVTAQAITALIQALAASGRELDVDAMCAKFGIPVKGDVDRNGTPDDQETGSEDEDSSEERVAPVLSLVRNEADAPAEAADDKADDASTEDAAEPDASLNGAQVSALLEILQLVARRELPRETGINAILIAFPIDRAQAESVMGEVGRTFFIEADGELDAELDAPAEVAA